MAPMCALHCAALTERGFCADTWFGGEFALYRSNYKWYLLGMLSWRGGQAGVSEGAGLVVVGYCCCLCDWGGCVRGFAHGVAESVKVLRVPIRRYCFRVRRLVVAHACFQIC